MEDDDFDVTNVPNFATPQYEVRFWRNKAHSLKRGMDELRKDFEEYQKDSKTLEVELDTQLKQTEQKNKDLTTCISRIQNDNENLRSRLEQTNAEHTARMAEWSAEVSSFRKTGDEINTYVRELEQKNDDLERANRAAAMSIEDFESKLNVAIERNAFLESELDEKENLKSLVQRLKDETRDLRYELQFTKRQSDKVVDSNKLEVTPPSTPPYNLAKSHQASLSSPTSSRMSPLSIVNDLLRKVGALETKLQTYHKKDEATMKKCRSICSKNHQNKAAAMSIEDFESKLNVAIERNAFLESELDEKENLKSLVQRLKDETRDLRYELQFTKRQSDKVVDSNKLEVTPPSTPPYNLAKSHQASLSSPTSSRMSPLSIVNDLLRKVGALETKLQTYHKKDEATMKKCRSICSKNHQNKSQSKLPRGVSSPSVQEIIKT